MEKGIRTVEITAKGEAFGWGVSSHGDAKILWRGRVERNSPVRRPGIYRAAGCAFSAVETPSSVHESLRLVSIPAGTPRCENTRGWVEAPGPYHGFQGVER